MKTHVYYRCTKDRAQWEHDALAFEVMEEQAVDVDFDEFAAHCRYEKVVEALGYSGTGIKIEDDWSVSFHRSTFYGLTCYIMRHTESDFIWLAQAQAEKLVRRYLDVPEDAWVRCTSYGKGGVDPRPK